MILHHSYEVTLRRFHTIFFRTLKVNSDRNSPTLILYLRLYFDRRESAQVESIQSFFLSAINLYLRDMNLGDPICVHLKAFLYGEEHRIFIGQNLVVQKEVLERPEKRISEYSMFNHLN